MPRAPTGKLRLKRRAAVGGAIRGAAVARALTGHMSGLRRLRTPLHMRRKGVQRQCRLVRGQAHAPEYRLAELRHPIGAVGGPWLSLLYIAASEPGYSFTLPYYPGAPQGCRAVRARYRKINNVTRPEAVVVSRRRLFGGRRSKERFPELFGMLYCESQNERENTRLVLSSRMIGVKAVAGQLLAFNVALSPPGIFMGARLP